DGNACTVDDTCGGGTCSGSLPGEADTVYATIDLSAAAPAPASTPAPHGVVLDADGNLYVSDLANDRIDVYDPAGSWLRGWGGYGTADGQLYDPRDLAIDRDNGLLFVADYGNNRVDVFTLEGAFVRKFTTGNLPRGIDFHDGLVYVGEQLGKRVSVWQPDGTFVRAIGSGPDSVYGVAVADNGDVYAVYGFYTLRWYSPTGVLLGTVGSQGTDPGQFDNHDGLTFDRGGNLWVVDRSNKRLQRLSADLQPGGIFAAGQLQDAFNLAVDDAGRVYVADASAHAIEIFWEPLGCSDGLDCTVLDTCVAGACADVTPRDCSDGDQCTADLCNPAGGACENPLRTYASSQLTEFATGGTTAALAVSGSHVYFGKTDQIRRKTLAGGGSANFSEGSMDPTAMVIGPGGVVYSLQSDGVYRYALTGPNLLGSFGSGGQDLAFGADGNLRVLTGADVQTWSGDGAALVATVTGTWTSGRSLALAATVALLACAGAYPLARALPAPLLFALFLISPLARALGVLGLGLAPGALAVALAELAGALPLAALLVLLRLRALDPRWLEAAADLGAGPWTRWRTITLPLLRPTLASAALWSALVSVGDIATLELAGG
ncbi:MAG: ABC transporter permease subunit, partial [Myxococcales bacterium]|nr:ABC transporter permease subunit [Myxococcales bacterium]